MKTQMIISSAIALGFVYTLQAIGAAVGPTAQGSVPPGCGKIEGRILDERSLPIEGVRVYSFVRDRPGRGRIHDALTDTDGRFTLDCAEPGENGIYLSKESDGYPDTLYTPFLDRRLIPIVRVVDQETVRGVEIHLGPKSGRLIVHVIDGSTLRPIENARLILCRGDDLDQCSWRGFSPGGELSMLLPPIPVCIKIEAPAYESWFYRKDPSPGKKVSVADVAMQGGWATPFQVHPMETKSLTIPLRRATK